VIGDLDAAALFDPDEFGVLVSITEPGFEARDDVPGMLGEPQGHDNVRRARTDAQGARGRPAQTFLQLFNQDVPAQRGTIIRIDGERYVIANIEPLGRLRSLLTLTPAAAAGKQQERPNGSWLRADD